MKLSEFSFSSSKKGFIQSAQWIPAGTVKSLPCWVSPLAATLPGDITDGRGGAGEPEKGRHVTVKMLLFLHTIYSLNTAVLTFPLKYSKKRIKSWKLTHLLSCRNGWVINGCYQDELLHNLFIELLKPNKTPNCKKKPGKIMFTQYFTWTLLFSNQLKVCD